MQSTHSLLVWEIWPNSFLFLYRIRCFFFHCCVFFFFFQLFYLWLSGLEHDMPTLGVFLFLFLFYIYLSLWSVSFLNLGFCCLSYISKKKLKIMSAITSSNIFFCFFFVVFSMPMEQFVTTHSSWTFCCFSYTFSLFSMKVLLTCFQALESRLCPVYWWNHQRHFSFMSLVRITIWFFP